MTTDDAANELRVSRRTVQAAILSGRLTATKSGRDWDVKRDRKFRSFRTGAGGKPTHNK